MSFNLIISKIDNFKNILYHTITFNDNYLINNYLMNIQ